MTAPDKTPLDLPALEQRWAERWEHEGTYRFQLRDRRDEMFAIDTPPPTVSGSLHVGHVFSYTHADVIARQRRMQGLEVFFPMGWDDNGLPTERRVQNAYNVRVDLLAPPDPALLDRLPLDGPPRGIARNDFIELCRRLTTTDEAAFETLFRRLGLSVDWRETYATIDARCRRLAQQSFLELYERGLARSRHGVTMWDIDFQTAVALAEVEERTSPGAFCDIAFGIEGSADSFIIATTRPELLPACVGVAAHPSDARYAHLIGRRAITPLFGASVPIFASARVDPDKGSGILMVCTFGDATDVDWWREERLPLRQIIGRDGRLLPIDFGSDAFPSRDAARANDAYAALAGRSVTQARAAILELLQRPGPDGTTALRGAPRPIERAVKFYEKGDRPLELLPTRQWFVSLLDHKEELLQAGRAIAWHPPSMGERYRAWTEGLGLDWAISRQRWFGVPIPAWYPLDERGEPDYTRPLLPAAARLPIDPTSDVPDGFSAADRDRPGGFTAERDVFDTWFTSSLTPQIAAGERKARLMPFDLRTQSHEIIRTWAFYTIVKALYHEGTIPWRQVAVSGWILDPDRKKMSKSRGKVVTPLGLLERFSSDGVRYWAASARLGTDIAFDEKMLQVGKRLVTKLWNAARFVHGHTAPSGPIDAELDRALLHALRDTVAEAGRAWDELRFAEGLQLSERFFWDFFTDAYIELGKGRARAGDGSAVATLRRALDVLVRLFAPVLPFVTEEIWRWTHDTSVHRAPWPRPEELEDVAAPRAPGILLAAREALAVVHRYKATQAAAAGRPLESLVLAGPPATMASLERVAGDVAGATRAASLQLDADDTLTAIAVRAATLAAAPARAAP